MSTTVENENGDCASPGTLRLGDEVFVALRPEVPDTVERRALDRLEGRRIVTGVDNPDNLALGLWPSIIRQLLSSARKRKSEPNSRLTYLAVSVNKRLDVLVGLSNSGNWPIAFGQVEVLSVDNNQSAGKGTAAYEGVG